MKSLALILCCFSSLVFCDSSQIVALENYNSTTPTKIQNVLDASKLYLASSDAAAKLGRITVTSNGQSKTLNQLLTDFDANGFHNGFPVNSDLTISTTNSAADTDALNGLLFISSPDMAKDPNFLVYSVRDQVLPIDRSNYNETTLVLLNLHVAKVATDPDTKPFFYTRVDGIKQPENTQLYMYLGVPGDGYTDPKLQANYKKLLFKNPISLLQPIGNPPADTVFFNNIEPIQYTLRSWHIRAVGGGIAFNVSRQWVDSTTYQTTKETTTGFTMSQRNTHHSTVTYKYTPNHDGTSGYMINTGDMFADMNVTSCNEGSVSSPAQSTASPVTSTQFPDTTTKSVTSLSTILTIAVMISNMI
ncbi:hypothetical protein CAEBREN_24595 [Caenorhabditis brenneri]|uniref:Uncharacterized protein n=1 Tax=Caenorhabditis brenneri TaxID=135651 RepID=G0N6I9_CAEBE|nr:hypothetical protein CAEBREN_24595 [Caenorhabditis brenneri]